MAYINQLSLQKTPALEKQVVNFRDLGLIDYQVAWDYQEMLLQQNVLAKSNMRNLETGLLTKQIEVNATPTQSVLNETETRHYLLFCEHPAVYTLGKSGSMKNVLLSDAELEEKNIQFFKINRGGDITFHGPQQLVGYPILDLEKFYTDIGRYLRELEEVIIKTLSEYGINGQRSKGETGVWIDADIPGKERKICAMGVRCSRWITMHGFALNVNTDLSYFNNIIPCGIENKQVTSIEKELNSMVNLNDVKEKLKKNFELVFKVELNNFSV